MTTLDGAPLGARSSTGCLADLEYIRKEAVQTVLHLLARCEKTCTTGVAQENTTKQAHTQQLLTAAIKDVEELDNRLHQIRFPHRS